MNEFDKIVRDKLNEEEDFPRMDQNWQKLSARMVAANAPPTPHPQLVAWKWAMAATGLLLVTSNIWWWFHQKETAGTVVSAPNIELKKADEPVQTTTIYKTDTVIKIVYRDVQSTKAQKETVVPKSNGSYDKIVGNNTPSVSKPNLDNKQPVINPQVEKNTPIVHGNTIDTKAHNDLKKAETPVFQDNKTVKNETQPVVSTEKKENKIESVSIEKKEESVAGVSSENNKKTPLNTLEKEGENVQKSQNTEGGVKAEQAVSSVENSKVDATNKTTSPTTKQDSDNKIAVADTPKETKTETVISPNKKVEDTDKTLVDADENKATPPPIIKPLKWKPIFSIGANAIIAFPAERELSALKGGGITVGLKLNDRFRADIAGSSGELDYNLRVHKPHWHIPLDPRDKPLGGPPRDAELREIRGHQIRKQAALSLTYLFQSKGWLTPKLELGYAIQRIAIQTARFEFRDRLTGTDLSSTEMSAAQTFKNLWSVGVGAEKSFGKFTADVTAAYQKDLSDKSVDMFVLRGGLRYSF